MTSQFLNAFRAFIKSFEFDFQENVIREEDSRKCISFLMLLSTLSICVASNANST